MNILGTPFNPWVTEQIKVRQASLGISKNIPTKNLIYQNAKSPWLRLSSTVDIKQVEGNDGAYNKLLALGFNGNDILNSNIAKNFILQGGTMYLENDTGNFNAGLNLTNQSFRGAYGWGGLDGNSELSGGRGYVPMPGVTGATITYLNNGALSKSTISMKCYSRNQLALMDMLYMRVGYNLLLEFGWSTYLNNQSELIQTDNFSSDALRFIFNPQNGSGESPNHFDILDKIQDERRRSVGNYEGVFGKITNFSWNFNPDGSYDCTTVLTGMGDMMESLKVNIKLPSKKDDDQNTPSTGASETELPPLVANKNKTTLNKKLFELYESVNSPSDEDQYWDVPFPSFPLAFSKINDDGTQSTEFKKVDLTLKSGMLSLQGVTTDAETNASPQVYITFGTLLAFIQKYLLIYNDKGCPLFTFDVDFENIEEDENFIVKIPGQFSSDPLVCLVPYTGLPEGVADDVTIYETSVNKTLSKKKPFVTNSAFLIVDCVVFSASICSFVLKPLICSLSSFDGKYASAFVDKFNFWVYSFVSPLLL